MKAMLLKKPCPVEKEPLQLVEIPDPRPGPGELRIKVHACGLCHTDLHILEGELPPKKMPVALGHQAAGMVDKIGEGVESFKPGDRVGLAWLASTCGLCSFCREGKENLCPQARFTGYDFNGGFAEYTLARQDFLFPLPERLSFLEAAPLLCAGIIGFRALRLSKIKPEQNLGLYGFGASAHLAIQVAKYWGCHIYVFTRGEKHRQLARELGAEWYGSSEDAPPKKLHSAIIFAPAGNIVPQALEALDRGGALALAGIYMSAVPEMDYGRHLYYEKTIQSVTNFTRQDAQDFLALAAGIPLKTTVETFSLEEVNKALLLLKQGKINGAGVIKITSPSRI